MRVPALSGPDPTGSNNFNRVQLWTRRRVQSFTTLLLATGYGLLVVLRASMSTFDARRVSNLLPRLRCLRLVAFILLSLVGSWARGWSSIRPSNPNSIDLTRQLQTITL